MEKLNDVRKAVRENPSLIEKGLKLIKRDISAGREKIDFLFKDRFGRYLIVKLKGNVDSKFISNFAIAVGNLSKLKNLKRDKIRIMIISNEINEDAKKLCWIMGIEYLSPNEILRKEIEFGESVKYINPFSDNFFELFTQKRIEMIKAIMEHAPRSIRELAKIVRRDIKNVFDDLKLLDDFDIIDFVSDGRRKRPIVKKEVIVFTFRGGCFGRKE